MEEELMGGETACSAPPGWWEAAADLPSSVVGDRETSRRIYTIGHSNRAFQEFVELLQENNVRLVADVRRYPGSRANPQYGRDVLPASLETAGFQYRHFPALGGRRTERDLRPENAAWRVGAFHAYADYALTPEFHEGLAELEEAARAETTAVMCAEAQWTRCHRRLIGDALVARGWVVQDIMARGRVETHRLPPFARVQGQTVTYPAPVDTSQAP